MESSFLISSLYPPAPAPALAQGQEKITETFGMRYIMKRNRRTDHNIKKVRTVQQE